MLKSMLLPTCCVSLFYSNMSNCVNQCHTVLIIWLLIHQFMSNYIPAVEFRSLKSFIKVFTASKNTGTGPQCRPFGRNTDGVKNEKSWDDICFTPKWVCSHAVDSFCPLTPHLFPVSPSQWWTWSSPPSLLPVILAFQARRPVRGPAKAGNALVHRPRGRMLVREFGSMECKERAREKMAARWRETERGRGRILKTTEEAQEGKQRGPNSKRPREKTHLVKGESLKLLSVS